MGGVTHAAKTLNVVSNAISMQLAALESELGGELFDRRTRPMALTPFGHFLYPKAREIACQFLQLEKDASFFLKDSELVCNVGFTRSMIFRLMPEVIKRFSAGHASTKINLTEALSEYQADLLLERKIDLGFTRELMKDPPHFRGLCAELLMVDPLVAVMPCDHPLASRKGVTLTELLGSPFVLYPKDDRSSYADSLMKILFSHACCPNVAQQAVEIHTAMALVSAGIGVSIVGNSLRSEGRQDLVFKPISDLHCNSYIYAISRPGCGNPIAKSFIRTMKKVIEEHQGC